MADATSSETALPSTGPSKKPSFTTMKTMWKTRTVDAFFAAGGAAGSLVMLQLIQDYLLGDTPVIRGFLVGSATKLFLNRNPPDLEAFLKSTAAAIVIGSSVHSLLWTNGPDKDGEITILSNDYNGYLMLFLFMLFWKLEPGTIWGAGKSLGTYIAFESGFWGRDASSIGQYRSFVEGFPLWYILSPYLVGHAYLYICALGLAKIRRRVRIHILKEEFLSNQGLPIRDDQDRLQLDRQKLRDTFDHMDINGNGRLDATELQVALRASVGADVSLEDCKYMIKSADSDGDGTIDFNEFCEAVGDVILH